MNLESESLMQLITNTKRLRQRLVCGFLMLVLLGSPFMPFLGGTHARAEESGKYLSADDLIASAAKYLGVPYKLG